MIQPRKWLLALIIAFGTFCFATLGWLADGYVQTRHQKEARDAFTKSELILKGQFEDIRHGLQGLVGLFSVLNGHPTIQQVHRYALSRDMFSNFPTVLGFGFVRRVPRAQQEAYVRKMQMQFPSFHLHSSGEPPPGANEDWIVETIQTLQEDSKAPGLIASSDLRSRNALQRAMETGHWTISAPVTLVSSHAAKGLLVFLPLYDTAQTPSSKEERISHCIGWAYAPLAVSKLFDEFQRISDAKLLVRLELQTTDGNWIDVFETLKPDQKYDANTHQHWEHDTFVLGERTWRLEGVLEEFYGLDLVSFSITFFTILLSAGWAWIVRRFASNILELEEARMKMIQASKMSALGEMAAGIAHEINNPLAVIALHAENINSALKDSEPEKANISAQKIQEMIARISKIVTGLRVFARDSSQTPREVVPVSQIIADTLNLCTERFKNNGIKLNVNTDATNANMLCYPTQITQVLMNLIGNAFDAVALLPEKWVAIEVVQKGNRIEIRVTDSGSGIPLQIREKLAQPFFTTKPAGKGTGLGLSISRDIVEKHGGRLFYNEQSSHTQFVVQLPVATQSNRLDKTASKTAQRAA